MFPPPLETIDFDDREKDLQALPYIDLQDGIKNFCKFYGDVDGRPTEAVMNILYNFNLLVLDFDKVHCRLRDYRPKPVPDNVTLARVSLLEKSRLDEKHNDLVVENNTADANAKQKRDKVRQRIDVEREIEKVTAAGFDGVLFTDVDRAIAVLGKSKIANRLQNILTKYKKRGKKIIFLLEDGARAFRKSRFLQENLNGVIFNNPTSNDGILRLKFGKEYNLLREAIVLGQYQMQQRVDFLLFGCETTSSIEAAKPELMVRFRDFCGENSVIGWVSTDPSFTDPGSIFAFDIANGPIELLSCRLVRQFLSTYDQTLKKKGIMANQLMNAEEAPSLEDLIDTKSDQFLTLANNYEGFFDELAKEFTAKYRGSHYSSLTLSYFWIHLAALAYKSIPLQDKETQVMFDSIYEHLCTLMELQLHPGDVELPELEQKKRIKDARRVRKFNIPDKEDEEELFGMDMWISGQLQGQKEFGITVSSSEFNRVVRIQERLRKMGMLKNLSEIKEREVYNPGEKNDVVPLPDPKFIDALKKLDRLLANPENPQCLPILKAFMTKAEPDVQHSNVLKKLQEMRKSLVNKNTKEDYNDIQVWESDPTSLKFYTLTEEKQYMAVYQIDEQSKVLHIYIHRHHPNFVEAILHGFFQTLGYNHTQCCLLEGLCRSGSTDFLSDRLADQLKRTPYKDLGAMIQRTYFVHQDIKNRDLSQGQTQALIRLSNEIMIESKKILLESVEEEENSKRINLLSLLPREKTPGPIGDIESLIKFAAWRNYEFNKLQHVLKVLIKGMEVSNTVDFAMSLVKSSAQNILRRSSLDEMAVQVRDANPYGVREPDLMTVYAEFNGKTEPEIRRLFGIGKHDLGQILFERIRNDSIRENPSLEEFKPKPKAYDKPISEVMGVVYYLKKFCDGLFFMFPHLINTILVLTVGIGLYSSIYIDRDDMLIAGVAMMCAFFFSGGLNGISARLGSLYMFQYSFSLVLAVLLRHLYSSVVTLTFLGSIAAIIIGIVEMSVAKAFIFLLYFLSFAMILMLTAMLYNTHEGSIWTCPQGIALIAANVLMVAIVYIFMYAGKVKQNPQYGAWVHLGAMLAAALVLMVFFVYYTHKKTMFITTITYPNEGKIVAWYCKSVGMDVAPLPTADQVKFNNDIKKWYKDFKKIDDNSPLLAKPSFLVVAKKEGERIRRLAWETFADECEAYLNLSIFTKPISKNRFAAEVQERGDQYDNEETLIHWYCLLTEKDRPRPFTKEWYTLVQEAEPAMKTKIMTDDTHRGGLLYEMTFPYIVYGTLYFFVLFEDKVIRYIFNGKAYASFIPSNQYEVALLWALVYLLVSIGGFEPVIHRMKAAENVGEPPRLGYKSSTARQLLCYREKELLSFYQSEILRLFAVMFLSVTPAAALLYGFSQWNPAGLTPDGLTFEMMWIFLLGLAAYSGFILSGYNMLFLKDKITFVNVGLILAIIIGFLAGSLLCHFLNNFDFAIIGASITMWLWYIWTALLIRTANAESGFIPDMSDVVPAQTLAMQTSGQHWIGKSAPKDGEKLHMKLISQLKQLDEKACIGASPSTIIGKKVVSVLNKSLARFKELPRTHILKRAFPDADKIIQTMSGLWSDDKIAVFLVPEQILNLTDTLALSAFSVRDIDNILTVYVGINEEFPQEYLAQQIAEGLLHEYVENSELQFSHSSAVAAEFLLLENMSSIKNDERILPARVIRQLNAIDEFELSRLENATLNVMLEIGTMGQDMDLGWLKLPGAVRQGIVAVLEYLRPDIDQFDDTIMDEIDPDFKNYENFKDLFTESGLARAQILLFLALEMKIACIEMKMDRQQAYTVQYIPIDLNPVMGIELEEPIFGETKSQDLFDFMQSHAPEPTFFRRKLLESDTFLRLCFLAMTGDPGFEREFGYSIQAPVMAGGLDFTSRVLAYPLIVLHAAAYTFIIMLTWFVLTSERESFSNLMTKIHQGHWRTKFFDSRTSLLSYIHHHDTDNPITAFVERDDGGDPVAVNMYKGELKEQPQNNAGRKHRMEYDEQGRLVYSLDFNNNNSANVDYTTFYKYRQESDRLPAMKIVFKGAQEECPDDVASLPNLVYIAEYNEKGRQSQGLVFTDYVYNGQKKRVAIEAQFSYSETYDNPLDGRPVQAVFSRVPDLDHEGKEGILRVKWHEQSALPAETEWESSTGKRLLTLHTYLHMKHPKLKTYEVKGDGKRFKHSTPLFLQDDRFRLLRIGESVNTVYQVDMLAHIPGSRTTYELLQRIRKQMSRSAIPFSRKIFLGPLPTRTARIELWKAWKKGKVEGVFARLMDDQILRKEPILSTYWSHRRWGRRMEAQKELTEKYSLIAPVVQIEGSRPDISSHLIIRLTDLLNFSSGGESHMVSMDQNDEADIGTRMETANPVLDVVGLDSGTWPADGGGVASCRRDLVDRLGMLRWHQISEVGNPMKTMHYQIEKNVKEMILVPLWGVDVGGPNEVVLSWMDFGEISSRRWRTTTEVVNNFWVPLIKHLVWAISTNNHTRQDMEDLTSLVVNIYSYFETYDWLLTWNHPATVSAWRKEWIIVEEARVSSNPTMDAERPTLDDFDFTLGLVMHFLMPLSVPLKDFSVYHCSHHGIQGLVGAVASKLFGSAYVIWDHGMMWRERVKATSEISQFSLFIRNALVGLTRIAVEVNFYTADAVVSCCSSGNPEWELRLGGGPLGCRTSRKMRGKMTPVVNGMETDSFFPRREVEEERPTSIMLSHVYDLKDIKNAIWSAVIIVNKFKLASFQLIIYGSIDKDVDYTKECRDIIAANGLSANVFLMGLGRAPLVVPRGWIFLNSSKSEGLPLALGEAGLAGLPVVCTDVGGSREVVSEGNLCYGRVVPPRNPMALARAQLEVLGMLGELQEVGSGPGEPPPSKRLELEDFAPIKINGPDLYERIISMKKHRRRLGMRFRAYIKQSFSMERYLREHEQLIWLGSMRQQERKAIVGAIISGQTTLMPPSDGEPMPNISHFRLGFEVNSELDDVVSFRMEEEADKIFQKETKKLKDARKKVLKKMKKDPNQAAEDDEIAYIMQLQSLMEQSQEQAYSHLQRQKSSSNVNQLQRQKSFTSVAQLNRQMSTTNMGGLARQASTTNMAGLVRQQSQSNVNALMRQPSATNVKASLQREQSMSNMKNLAREQSNTNLRKSMVNAAMFDDGGLGPVQSKRLERTASTTNANQLASLPSRTKVAKTSVMGKTGQLTELYSDNTAKDPVLTNEMKVNQLKQKMTKMQVDHKMEIQTLEKLLQRERQRAQLAEKKLLKIEDDSFRKPYRGENALAPMQTAKISLNLNNILENLEDKDPDQGKRDFAKPEGKKKLLGKGVFTPRGKDNYPEDDDDDDGQEMVVIPQSDSKRPTNVEPLDLKSRADIERQVREENLERELDEMKSARIAVLVGTPRGMKSEGGARGPTIPGMSGTPRGQSPRGKSSPRGTLNAAEMAGAGYTTPRRGPLIDDVAGKSLASALNAPQVVLSKKEQKEIMSKIGFSNMSTLV